MHKPYSELWDRLRIKYIPGYKRNTIYIVLGKYPIAYEGDIDWIVGYCINLAVAEYLVTRLTKELKDLSRSLGPLWTRKKLLLDVVHNEKDPEIKKKLWEEWIDIEDVYRDAVDKGMSGLSDKRMPNPYGMLFRNGSRMDGPIQYYITPVMHYSLALNG